MMDLKFKKPSKEITKKSLPKLVGLSKSQSKESVSRSGSAERISNNVIQLKMPMLSPITL
jgi:hypothetical protein